MYLFNPKTKEENIYYVKLHFLFPYPNKKQQNKQFIKT